MNDHRIDRVVIQKGDGHSLGVDSSLVSQKSSLAHITRANVGTTLKRLAVEQLQEFHS